MKKRILITFFIISILFVLTGCKNNTNNNTDKSKSNNDINSIVGKYELSEMKINGIPISAKDWNEATSMELFFEIKNNNTAVEITKYSESMEDAANNEKHNYTYDDQYFYLYDTEKKETKAHYQYEFSSGVLTLKDIENTNNNYFIYKKK